MSIRIALAAAAATFSFAAIAAAPTEPANPAVLANPELPPDTVLVKKGDITVTAGDLYAFLEKMPEDQRFYFRGDVERITNALSSIFIFRELTAEARAQGIDKDPQVQKRIQQSDELILGQTYLQRFEKSIVPPDFTGVAEEMYKANPDRYKVPETARVRQIVVGSLGRTDEETRKRAEEARKRLLAGEPFTGNIVREFSTEPRARVNDGLMEGPYKLWPPEVVAVAKKIALNTVSEPIKSSDGYHIILVEERVPAHIVPFDKVKAELIDNEQKKYRRARIDEKLGTITKSKDVVIYTDAIAALKTEPDRAKLSEMHQEKAREENEEKQRLIEQAAKVPPK